MNWFSRKKRDSNLEPMQGQSREEANSGLDEAQRAREQLALESMQFTDRVTSTDEVGGGPGRIQ